MPDRAKRKQQQRQKRRDKRRQAQRAQGGSPYARIGDSGELVACYVNRDWREDGKASLYLLRRVPGGGHAMAAFLVDLWCIGLKDAWGRLDISYSDFIESIERVPREADLVRVDLDLARRLVAGGIRFAGQNGFRLPRNYRRWTALLGGLPDPETADLSDFGVDGGLQYVGPMDDLRQRLAHGTVEEFLSRKDVKYLIEELGPALRDETELAVDEVADLVTDRALEKVRQWCFSNGLVPHPRLPDVIELTLESVLQAGGAVDDEENEQNLEDEELDDRTAEQASANFERFLSLEPPVDAQGLSEAIAQLTAFMGHYSNPEEMFADLGLDDLGEED